MSSKIIKYKKIPLTYDEFKAMILEYNSSKSRFDSIADIYDRVPSYIRVIQNFDPTGIAGAIDQILSENKAKREQDNILRAIYNLVQAIQKYSEQLTALEQDYLSQQAPQLTYKYFDLSEKTFEPSKIELFRNIWLNGLINVNRRSGEKSAIFDLVATLTEDEILALRVMFDEQYSLEFKERKPVHVEKIAQVLNMEIEYAQQICVSLQSRGLSADFGIGTYGYKGPVNFVITDYSKLLVEYINEPNTN
jgi:hypothetical protein